MSDCLAENTLAFLVGDQETGWGVARNPHKILNHLDFIRQQEAIAQAPTEQTLRQYAAVRHLEFHPADVCALACQGCTYGFDRKLLPPRYYPMEGVDRLAQLRPGSMLIVGGGEPTLYNSGAARFPQLIEEIDYQMPGIVLALVTNGVYRPPGNWPERLAWLRVSLDAATPQTYYRLKGVHAFGRVLDNFLDYLDMDIPYVGIGFVFSKANVREYAPVARLIFDFVRRERPDCLPRVNIQYRPLRDDYFPAGFPLAVDEQDIRGVVDDLEELAGESPEMEAFLRDQTNARAILAGNIHTPQEFGRCYYAEVFKIVRANGDVRPCCIRVLEPDLWLGNILTDSLESIACRTMVVADRSLPFCSPRYCRMGGLNRLVERGLRGEIQPPISPQVVADPMF